MLSTVIGPFKAYVTSPFYVASLRETTANDIIESTLTVDEGSVVYWHGLSIHMLSLYRL